MWDASLTCVICRSDAALLLQVELVVPVIPCPGDPTNTDAALLHQLWEQVGEAALLGLPQNTGRISPTPPDCSEELALRRLMCLSAPPPLHSGPY